MRTDRDWETKLNGLLAQCERFEQLVPITDNMGGFTPYDPDEGGE